MKNNTILMLAAIIALFTLAVALYGAGALLPGQTSGAQADNETIHTAPDASETGINTGDTVTAFEALTAASADPNVKAWMAAKKIVYVSGISSDFCKDGLSNIWSVSFASDDGQLVACVIGGKVAETRLSEASPQQGLDPSKAIDSAEIWQQVAGRITSAGGEMPQTVAMALKVSDGNARWDVSYEATDGLHILRADAGNGTVTDQITIGR